MSTERGMDKEDIYTHTHMHIYRERDVVYTQNITQSLKRMSNAFVATWMDLEIVIQVE